MNNILKPMVNGFRWEGLRLLNVLEFTSTEINDSKKFG